MLNLKGLGARMPRNRFSRPEPYRSKTKPYRWLGQWHVYRTVDGKETRHHKGPIVLGPCASMSKAEAQTELERRIAEDAKPKATPVDATSTPVVPGTVAAELEAMLVLDSAHCEPETDKTHRSIVSRQINPALGEQQLSEVTREQIQALLNTLAETKSESTVKKARNLLGRLFSLALEDGKIAKNPMRLVKRPRTRKPDKRFLTEEECQALIAATHGRNRLIIRLCVVLGLRPGEVLALRRDDCESDRIRIDEASREGKVKKPKTEASAAWVTLPPGLAIELRHWLDTSLEDPAGFVFPSDKPGHPLRQNNFRKRILQPLARKAGIEGVTFQQLRRTTATHAGTVGTVKDAQAMLRHANPDMTAGVYMQSIPESVRKAVEELEKKIGGQVQ